MIDNNQTIRVLDIVRGTTVDGPGFRTSIYVAGCRHRCPGCHNPESWDFLAGQEMALQEILDVVREEDFDVTFSGGDPMYHPAEIVALSRKIHEMGHSVWLYTGFTWEELVKSEVFLMVLQEIDVIVEGPFVESLRDTDLLFRGSFNQRIVDVRKSLVTGCLQEWHR